MAFKHEFTIDTIYKNKLVKLKITKKRSHHEKETKHVWAVYAKKNLEISALVISNYVCFSDKLSKYSRSIFQANE